MIKYRCTVCSYIYDPEVGDAPRIKPGTAFEDIPEDWVCPQCAWARTCLKKYKGARTFAVPDVIR